uniref:NADH dehydrogenase subunit 6 n=1 Tax=Zele chlorophthalmus TaxID=1080924 RepID=A0A345X0P8_ZELCH|nr:NADH dehydrogenase subunit 6 [Zele chlorophthalmus]AXK15290.1 NADH dehydrogenase subunit 6 [Zele chlorophthalmus]
MPSYTHKFHPMSMMMLLMSFSLILVLKLNYLNSTYWYSYILFLLMIGGVMILFLYLTSISNNELFIVNLKYYSNFFLKIWVMFFLIYILKLNLSYFNDNSLMLDNYPIHSIYKIEFTFLKNLFMNFYITIYMLFYLFIMMVSTVLICSKNCIPLRQMYNYEFFLKI